jgi:tRNA nucleotidyltransferase (CCA-adding enzyme)
MMRSGDMAIRRTGYPQVDPRAEGLMTRAIVRVPSALSVGAAARLARRRRARLVVARVGPGWGGATVSTLDHALRLGVTAVPVAAVLWRTRVVAPGSPEVVVRRALGPGTPFVLVGEGDRVAGAVLADEAVPRALPLSASDRLGGLSGPLLDVLRRAGALAGQAGWPLVLVGGLVRDLLTGQPLPVRVDLDLTVQGDAQVLARRLVDELGADSPRRPREHPVFLTATVELPGVGRVDVTTARRERYRAPGALPEVEPASIAADLWRRDFSVNALAIRLDGPGWGQVLDPTGGLADLRRRRIRVLHALSFIEDPTRLFRAIRFAVRLDGGLDPATRHLFRAAARLTDYAALSGERLRAELRLIRQEAEPAEVLVRAGRLGAFRLLSPAYRFARESPERLRRVAALVRRVALDPDTEEALYVLALTVHLPPGSRAAWAGRLGLPPTAWAAAARAAGETGRLLARLDDATDPAEAYKVLLSTSELGAAWAGVLARPGRLQSHVDRYLGAWRRLPRLVTGDDVRAMGLAPGPAVGRILDELCAAQAAGRVRTRSGALAWARAAVARRNSPRRGNLPERETDSETEGGAV